MWLTDSSPVTVAPLLLQNLVIAFLIYADKFLVYLAKRYRFLHAVRYLLLSSFFFLVRVVPSFFFDFLVPSNKSFSSDNYTLALPTKENHVAVHRGGVDSGIARALSQLLSIVTDIPVSSRKYEVVRSLAERIIEENHQEGNDVLREVNRSVLSLAFERTLSRLEAAVVEVLVEPVMKAVRTVRAVHSRLRARWEANRWDVISAEKLAAELLWLAQKLAACGSGDEAVTQWAAASNLAWVALTAEPRLQGSMVKVTALLFMEANKTELNKVTKLKMMQTWLPFLCRAGNGTDAPVLSLSERSDLEKVLEETIEELEDEEDQEHVLFLWLHHFTHSSSSDWPNLHGCYARWCSASRRQLMLLQ
ncbi:uncharacterized protein LOC129304738 [Prosopis cineraria]|uniref:uncharacterized protein LOC129304738 n=1 Tax=Prosopis cineraria TaxID=364024 RepID=UPI00240EB445|nr:uncharacterized protein LOC129304738 [Prosopis cineraria]